MNRTEELDLFLEKADDLLGSKYIFSDVKIAGLLKAVAASEVIVCMMENALKGFDYESAYAAAFVTHGDDPRGEYRQPENTKDMIALVFSVLVKIDDKKIDLGALMKGYFYADGSMFNSYAQFLADFVKPYKNAVKLLFEGINSGKFKNPAEVKPAAEVTTRKLPDDLAFDSAAVRVANVLVEEDRVKFISGGLEEDALTDVLILLGGLSAALESGDKDGIKVAFTGYKYFAADYKKLLLNVERLRVILKNGKLL